MSEKINKVQIEEGWKSALSSGCGHFVKTNEVLEGQGKLKIDWQV